MAIVLTSQSLQQVVDAGNTSSRQITISNNILSGATDLYGLLSTASHTLGGSLSASAAVAGGLTLGGSTAYTGLGYAGNFTATFNATNSGATIGGVSGTALLTSAQNITRLVGVVGGANYTDGATLIDVIGGDFGAGGSNSPTITRLTGVKSAIGVGNSPVIGTLVNFDATRTVLATATVTDAYGFRLTDFTSGNAPTNSYGIYIPALTLGTNKFEYMVGGAGRYYARDVNTSMYSSVSGTININASTIIACSAKVSSPTGFQLTTTGGAAARIPVESYGFAIDAAPTSGVFFSNTRKAIEIHSAGSPYHSFFLGATTFGAVLFKPLTASPSGGVHPINGEMYVHDDGAGLFVLKIYNGTAWVNVGSQ